jgi:RimJ/RimL family protein N-acetyltransferase
VKTLETPRLLLRAFTLADLPEAHAVLDNDLQWSGPGFTLDQRRARLQFYQDLARWDDTGRLYGARAVILKATAQLIGLCGFHPDVWLPNRKAAFWPQLFPDGSPAALTYTSLELGLGYGLASSARGQGYATEAVQVCLTYAFGELQINRVFAITDRDNLRSAGLMRRVGMRTARHPDPETVYPGLVGVIESSSLASH